MKERISENLVERARLKRRVGCHYRFCAHGPVGGEVFMLTAPFMARLSETGPARFWDDASVSHNMDSGQLAERRTGSA